MECKACRARLMKSQADDHWKENDGPYCRACYERKFYASKTEPAPQPRPMTHQKPAVALRVRLIGAIHAAANKAGIDEDTRRELQRDCVGKDSCADMTENELRRVLERISPDRSRHARPGQSPRPGGRTAPRRPAPQRDKVALVRKVYALLEEAGRPVSYAEGILKHMFKDEAPDALEWAKPDQLWRVVAALEYDKKRRTGRDTRP